MKLRSIFEINTFLAEHLFGYKVEEVTSAVKVLHGDGYIGGIGKLIKLNDDFYASITNYVSHWESVFEKLATLTDNQQQCLQVEYNSGSREFYVYVVEPFNEINPIFCKGESQKIGEAVCFAAIEYLELREAKK